MFVVALALVLVSFRPVYTLDDITYAIRLGNAGELSRFLDNRVDISLLKNDVDQLASASQPNGEMAVVLEFSASPCPPPEITRNTRLLQEIVSIIQALVVAGADTAVDVHTLGIYALLSHPEQRALLRARPDLSEAAVVEILQSIGVM